MFFLIVQVGVFVSSPQRNARIQTCGRILIVIANSRFRTFCAANPGGCRAVPQVSYCSPQEGGEGGGYSTLYHLETPAAEVGGGAAAAVCRVTDGRFARASPAEHV